MNTDKGARDVQEQLEDSDKVLDRVNTSAVLNPVFSTIINEFEPNCLDKAVRLLNAHSICQSTDDHVPKHKNSIPGLPGSQFLAHQVGAIWFVVRRLVRDAEMPGALVAVKMCLGKTFTLVAAAMICKLVTKNVVMGLPLSIIWGNALEEWVILAHNYFPGIVSEERERDMLQRFNPVPCCLLEIQTTPPHRHPVHQSALNPVLVVTMPGVAETFQTVIDKMTDGTDFKLVNMLKSGNVNLNHEYGNTRIEKPENRCNIHLVWYDNLTSRSKPSSNRQLSYCAWSVWIFDESDQYMPNNSMGWQIVMNAKFGFKLQVTATEGFHSLYDWCYRTMWLIWGVPDDPEKNTVTEKHAAKALYSAVKSIMYAIQTDN